MAIAKRKIEKSSSITVKIDGSLDVRFTLERRPQAPWTVAIETSEDGEVFEPIKTSKSMHPAVILAASAPAVQALVAEFEWDEDGELIFPASTKTQPSPTQGKGNRHRCSACRTAYYDQNRPNSPCPNCQSPHRIKGTAEPLEEEGRSRSDNPFYEDWSSKRSANKPRKKGAFGQHRRRR